MVCACAVVFIFTVGAVLEIVTNMFPRYTFPIEATELTRQGRVATISGDFIFAFWTICITITQESEIVTEQERDYGT